MDASCLTCDHTQGVLFTYKRNYMHMFENEHIKNIAYTTEYNILSMHTFTYDQ